METHVAVFTGDGDIEEFLEKVSLYVAFKEYTGEKKAQVLASKLGKEHFKYTDVCQQMIRKTCEGTIRDDRVIGKLP